MNLLFLFRELDFHLFVFLPPESEFDSLSTKSFHYKKIQRRAKKEKQRLHEESY